ncbi:MAG: amino acid adenylation domain-containing protein [Pirellulaceae bacterium]
MIELTRRVANLSPGKRELLARRLASSPEAAEPIAIVGMGCRFAGAGNVDQLWGVIRDGRIATGVVPASRWDADEYYDEDYDALGKMATKWGGFVDDVDQFDPQFFGITPREAERMDPQQRLLLEVSWEALEHAGIAPERLRGSSTGVFVGIGGTDYSKVACQYGDYFNYIDAHVGTGNALSIAANRISYILDFHGPSLAVDTACSSGMVGIHMAVQSLRNWESDAALAGGVNLILAPDVTIAFSKARMLSPDGKCRPFDAGANGYVRGEGCAMIVLKRLTDAVRDGDNVLAVIRGTAINQDGRTSGITAPNSLYQQAAIRAALAEADLTPDDVTYIEAHGTGTPLGDPIEVQSLGEIFRAGSGDLPPVHVGSVKANIGHTETVSGVAGVIKTVLLMQHGQIAPQAHLEQLNPHIKLEGTRLRFPTETIGWQGDHRIAGVSSFGFGGANAHVVLEAAAPREISRAEQDRSLHVLTISAKSKTALPTIAAQYADFLRAHEQADPADVCHSANTGRTHFNHRLAVVADTHERLLEKLSAVAEGKKTGAKVGRVDVATRPKTAFLFTGQGSQYTGMGRELYETQPVFRRAIDRCEEILDEHLTQRLTSVLYGESDYSAIDETAYTQPALFAVEYALSALWRSWGVEPDVVLGHSVGEYVAAVVAGVMSLEDGLKLIAHRGRLMQSLPRDGSMAVVFAPRASVELAVAGREEEVSVAAANGPENTVISGKSAAVEELAARFAEQGVRVERLTVSHAFHSPLMTPMLDEFEAIAGDIQYSRPRVPIIANVTGQQAEDDTYNARYWRDHVRGAVCFEEGMRRIDGHQVHCILEIGPAPVLLGMGRRCLPESRAKWLPSLRKGQADSKVILAALSDLYLTGVKINWSGFDRDWPRQRLVLPTYPFQRSRMWLEIEQTARVAAGGVGPKLHPLLGRLVPSALDATLFENSLGARSPKYLIDHQVQGSPVTPGAAYIEQALAAAEQMFGPGRHSVESVTIQQAMFLQEQSSRTVQVAVSPELGGRCTFETYSIAADAGSTGGAKASWQMHAAGTIVHGGAKDDDARSGQAPRVIDLAQVRAEAVGTVERDLFYQQMATRGLAYGPAFQVLSEIVYGPRAALAKVELSDAVLKESADYYLHPALLDACLQGMASAIPPEADGSQSPYTYMPTGIGRVRLHGEVGGEMYVYVERTSDDSGPSPDVVEADVLLVDGQGRVLVELNGVHVQRLGRSGDDQASDPRDWLYAIQWRRTPLDADVAASAHDLAGSWLVFADQQGVADALVEQIAARGGRAISVEPGDAFARQGDRFTIDPLSTDDYQQLLEQALAEDSPACRGVVHLWSLDLPSPQDNPEDAFKKVRRLGCGGVLRLMQQLAKSKIARPPHVWLATRGAQVVVEGNASQDSAPVAVEQTPLWGLGRVAALEHPELRTRLIDLDPAQPTGSQVAGNVDRLIAELAAEADEDQVAYRDGQRLVARLAATPDAIARDDNAGMNVPDEGPFRIRLGKPGSIDSLRVESFRREPPEAGQVEIEVHAAGLNFSDVLKAMGLYPGIKDKVVPLGIECSGVVTAVGEGVKRFGVGDEVLGVAPYSFASHARTAEFALVPKPASINDADACTIPITFLTAYYALVRLAQLQPGERFLIHAGAGGVGLAAIQIAQQIGAEIFATAGSDEKRQFLRDLGVPHVMNSRSLDFADEIQEITGRRGVDVVLNSLPGEAIDKSLASLAAYGRFCEIGKTDIYMNRKIGLLPFQDNLSYFAIDLDRMLRQRPDYMQGMFTEMMQHFESGAYRPLNYKAFPIEDTVGAFRYMAQRKNIGKVVVTLEQRQREVEADSNRKQIRGDGAYLITGGLGALGLEVARWLTEKGAGSVALMSRGEPNERQREAIDQLKVGGAKVSVVRGDVTDLASLTTALASLSAGLPLRGVFHAAGVLDDGVMFDMDLERLDRPMRPKVQGAWNLHTATRDCPLDLFVMFSSVACVLGSPGQANYAAANAFLDGLAAHRRGQGLPATSINWGPWAEGGMAADASKRDQLTARGMNLMPAHECLRLLEALLEQQTTQSAVMSVRWRDMLRQSPAVPPLLRDVAPTAEEQEENPEDAALRAELAAADPAEREKMLVAYFTEQLATIMGLEPDDFDVVAPLNTLGLDSLMAIELKNKIESRLKVVLPVARFMEGPSVTTLAQAVAESMGDGAAAQATLSSPTAAGNATTGRQPLSHGQQALWFLYQLAPHSSAYNICDAVRVHGPLDVEALRRALQRVVDRHSALRTTFHDDDGQPYQRIRQQQDVACEVVDAADWTPEQIQQRLSTEVHSPFDLETGPLARVVVLKEAGDRHLLIFVVHHIIADFWSMVSVTDEFKQFYAAETIGAEIDLPDMRLEYSDFTRWQQEMLAGEEGEAHWRYWREQLDGALPILDFPTDKPRPPVQTFEGDLAFHFIEPALTARLKRLGEAHGATLNMVLLAAYEMLLARYTGQRDILVGIPTSGRTRADLGQIVGYFVNPVVVRGDLSGEPSAAEFVEQIRDRMIGALDHQDYPFSLLVERLQPRRDASRTPIFQTMFAMQKAQIMHDEGLTPFMMGQSGAEIDFAGLKFESTTLEQWISQFEISLVASEADDGISLMAQYNTDLFVRETIELMIEHYVNLLTALAGDASQPVSSLTMLSERERQVLLRQWSGAEAAEQLDAQDAEEGPHTFHELFERQAALRGDAAAVVEGVRSWTYRELNEQANRIAHLLQERGVRRGDLVGLCFERSLEAIAALLGVVKAGAAYVPIDPKLPAERIAYMLGDCGAKMVLTRNGDAVSSASTESLSLDELRDELQQASTENPKCESAPDDVAYAIYTSGSTGQAKAALIEHRSLAAMRRAWRHDYQLDAGDVHLQMAGFAFDVFTGDLARSLCCGGRLVLCPSDALLEPTRLYELMRDAQVNCVEFVPAVLRLLMRRLQETGRSPDFLRLIVVGSDVWYMADHRQLRSLCAADARVVNGYGVTEATIDSTYFTHTDVELPADAVAPIGRPFSGCRVYVLDEQFQLTPVGAVGELCIGGPSVARGYLNRPELTAERFITPEWSDGLRLYRTGDLVRFLSDGALEFLGRGDQQVKVNGFRIELGEIEAALAGCDGVRQAVVHPWKDAAEQTRLAAYLVADGEPPDVSTLRELLAQTLPDYMIPAAMVVLDELPLGANGKIDRRALPEPIATRPDLRIGYLAPRNDLEMRLTSVWEEVLGVEPIGVRDNFFELGGHSMLAVQLISRVSRQFERELPLASLLRDGTIERMAVLLHQADGDRPWTPLVPIRPHGEMPPLFCVHPAGGNVLCYHELAHAVAHDRPVYALEARGADGRQPPHATLDEMIFDYIEAIRAAQPAGPYHLVGWSSGGVVGYEIARRLQDAGETIASVSLLDSRVMSSLEFDPDDESRILATLADFLDRFYGFRLGVAYDDLAKLDGDARLEYLLQQARRGGNLPLELDAADLRTFVDVARANLRLLHDYAPPAGDLPVTLFRAAEQTMESAAEPGDDFGWSAIVGEALTITTVRGDHISMMTGAQVKELGAAIEASIAPSTEQP